MNKKEFVDLLSRLRPDKDVELFGSQIFNGNFFKSNKLEYFVII